MNIEYIEPTETKYAIKIRELFKLFQTSIDDFEEDIKILEKIIRKGIKL